MYVHSMFAGRHCCLYCDITSEKMQIPLKDRRPSERRTLASLERDHYQFSTVGGGNIKNAKQYNNVISKPLFNIPVSQVSLWVGLSLDY